MNTIFNAISSSHTYTGRIRSIFSFFFWIYKQSFAQKLTGLVTGPTDAPPDDTPWYLRYGARGLGIFGAFCEYFGIWLDRWFWHFPRKLFLTMTMFFSCHPVWILELLWSADDKLFERIVGYPANISWNFGDVNWGASLLHVFGSCTKISPSCWKPAPLLSRWGLLHVSCCCCCYRHHYACAIILIGFQEIIANAHFHFSIIQHFLISFSFSIERQYHQS